MENIFYQMNERLQRIKETQINQAFCQIYLTIIEFNIQQNKRIGNISNSQRRITLVSEFRPQRSETQTIDAQDTTLTEPLLPFCKLLTSMSTNEETPMEPTNSIESVPTTIKLLGGRDPGYTVEE